MSNKRFLFIYLCSVFIATASGTCYWINGAEAPDRFTCSDPNTVGASMCCAKESSMFFDSCTDGICAYTYASGALGPYDDGLSFWRDSCTDHTWRNPACVTIDSHVNGSQVRLSKCADGSFCPRNTSDPNTICCDNHLGQFARNASVKLSAGSTSTTLNPTAATSTFFSHSSPSSSTEDSKVATSTSLLQSAPSSGTPESESETSRSLPQNSQGDGSGLNRGSEIAAIVGSVFGALAFIAMIVFGINGWRKHRSSQQPSHGAGTSHH